jgi:hypothetical protein
LGLRRCRASSEKLSEARHLTRLRQTGANRESRVTHNPNRRDPTVYLDGVSLSGQVIANDNGLRRATDLVGGYQALLMAREMPSA